MRSLAQKNLQAAQRRQKSHYDRRAKHVKLKVGDLVMLSVQPKFKLDRRFKGPFVIEPLTATNAIIRVKGDSHSELWNVSGQRLSKCSESLAVHEPWLGQSSKLRKCRVVKKKLPVKDRGLGGTGARNCDINHQERTYSKQTCSVHDYFLR